MSENAASGIVFALWSPFCPSGKNDWRLLWLWNNCSECFGGRILFWGCCVAKRMSIQKNVRLPLFLNLTVNQPWEAFQETSISLLNNAIIPSWPFPGSPISFARWVLPCLFTYQLSYVLTGCYLWPQKGIPEHLSMELTGTGRPQWPFLLLTPGGHLGVKLRWEADWTSSIHR